MSNSTLFQPTIESVSEFLERFKVTHATELEAAATSQAKATILCKALPVTVITDVQRRIKPVKLTVATYDQIEEQLIAQYEVKKSVIGAAVKFIGRKQHHGESIDNYARSLNDLASNCSYKECCRDRLIRDIFVAGLNSSKLMSTLLQEGEDKDFNFCIQRAKTLEQLAYDAADINPDSPTISTYKVSDDCTSRNKITSNYMCFRCGAKGKHYVNKCPMMNSKCYNCNKTGHIAKVCKSKKSTNLIVNDDDQDELQGTPYMNSGNHCDCARIPSSATRAATNHNPATSRNAATSQITPHLSANQRHECCASNQQATLMSHDVRAKEHTNDHFLW